MKPNEIRDMESEELEQKLLDSRTELFNLRFRLATGQLDNPALINGVKKDIARVHTEIRSREIHAEREARAS